MQMDDCKIIAVSYAICPADISPFKLRLINVTAYWAICLYIVSAVSYTDIYALDQMKNDSPLLMALTFRGKGRPVVIFSHGVSKCHVAEYVTVRASMSM